MSTLVTALSQRICAQSTCAACKQSYTRVCTCMRRPKVEWRIYSFRRIV